MEAHKYHSELPALIRYERQFLLVMLGPAVVFSTLMLRECPSIDFDDTAVFALIGAIWGLATGILRQSLLRAVLGLNIGAALGTAGSRVVIEFGANDIFSTVTLALAGGVLGAAMNARWKTFSDTAMQGAISGFASFGLMGALLFTFTFAVDHFRCAPGILAIGLVAIALMAGLGLFLWLIIDHGDSEPDGCKPLERLRPRFPHIRRRTH
jgi:hypothetical protein